MYGRMEIDGLLEGIGYVKKKKHLTELATTKYKRRNQRDYGKDGLPQRGWLGFVGLGWAGSGCFGVGSVALG